MLLAWLLQSTLAATPAELTAVGIVLSPRPGANVAILRAGERQRVVEVGDAAFGARVVSISSDGVGVERAGERSLVRLAAASAAPAVPPRPATNELEAPEDPATPSRTFERRDVERRIAQEAPRILGETALTPVMDGSAVAGFSLARIPDGTVLSEAGLRPGDVLTRVNDVPIDSLATLIGLWSRLQGSSEVRAVVVRNGRPVTLTVRLR